MWGRSVEEIAAEAARCGNGQTPGVLVVDAAAIGPRVPTRARVVEVLRRADTVVAERSGPSGLVRLVRVGDAELIDAGAQPVDEDLLAFPPENARAAAAELAEASSASVSGVVLASRATPTGEARSIATHDADGRLAACLSLTDAPAVLVLGSGPGVDDVRTGDVQGNAVGDRTPAAGEVAPHGDAGAHVGPVGLEGRGAHPGTDGLGGVVDLDGRYEAVRAALGVAAGTPDAVDIGIPSSLSPDPVEERVARACRGALRPLPTVPPWHPSRRHVAMTIDPTQVTATVLQIGVRLDAPDDLTLGTAIARLVTALAAEDVQATPVRHERTPSGVAALVAFIDAT